MPRGHFILPQVTHRARGAITLTYAKAFTSVLNGPTRVKLLDPISIKLIHVRSSRDSRRPPSLRCPVRAERGMECPRCAHVRPVEGGGFELQTLERVYYFSGAGDWVGELRRELDWIRRRESNSF